MAEDLRASNVGFAAYSSHPCRRRRREYHARRPTDAPQVTATPAPPKEPRIFSARRVFPGTGLGTILLRPGDVFSLGTQTLGNARLYSFSSGNTVTVKTAGEYRLRYMAAFSGGTHDRSVGVSAKSASGGAGTLAGSVFSDSPLWGECHASLRAGDALQLVYLSDTNGSVGVNAGAADWTQAFFSIEKLAEA
jgi:hypothetical protein